MQAKFKERQEAHILDQFKSKETVYADRYNTSKLLVILIARELAKSMDERGNNPIVLNTLNPGLCKSELFRHVRFPISWIVSLGLTLVGRTNEMGSRTLLAAAVAGKETHGKYMDACEVGKESLFITSEEGVRVQTQLYGELMELLEKVEPGITNNI